MPPAAAVPGDCSLVKRRCDFSPGPLLSDPPVPECRMKILVPGWDADRDVQIVASFWACPAGPLIDGGSNCAGVHPTTAPKRGNGFPSSCTRLLPAMRW